MGFVHQVLADLLLRTTPVKHTGELDDRGSTVDRQPTQDVHGER